jgi:ketosteroid isomerase-like protein
LLSGNTGFSAKNYLEITMQTIIIETLEAKLREAMLSSNVSVLDELIADDLAFTLPNGFAANKQMDLEAHRSGTTKFTKIDITDRQIHDYGACMVVMVKAELAGTFNEQPFAGTHCYTRVWMQRQEQWQIVAGHVSAIASA